MQTISIRELKSQATAIIRNVREQRAEYVVTYRGAPVATIAPVHRNGHGAKHIKLTTVVQSVDDLTAELDKLADELAGAWPEGLTAAEAVSSQRR